MIAEDGAGPETELVYLDGILVEATQRGIHVDLSQAPSGSEDELAGGVTERIAEEAPKLGHTITHFCGMVHDAVKGLSASEITAEFAIAIKGGVGVPFVTSGTAEAVVKVKATWTKKPDS